MDWTQYIWLYCVISYKWYVFKSTPQSDQGCGVLKQYFNTINRKISCQIVLIIINSNISAFRPITCDMWMSLDVHFSTVSTLHLCCIAVDRYFAIVRPLKYTTYMTVKVAACMIAVAWTAPIVISFLPIFLGWNTTQDHIDWRELHQDECILRVIYHS